LHRLVGQFFLFGLMQSRRDETHDFGLL
jgi:hypothetical protein